MTGAAGTAEQPKDVKAMSMEEMLKMRQALEEQIKSLEGGAGGYGGAADPAHGAGKFSSAAQQHQVVDDEDDLDDADSPPEPRRLTVGQLYQVCHKFVAVRSAPALDAPFLRRLNQGAKVELFEWDRSRRWRRMVVEKVNDSFKAKAPERIAEGAKRWACENPVWDNEKQCWTDGGKRSKIEVLDESDDEETKDESIVHTDGWVMVQHPEFGLLVEAIVPASEEDTAAATANSEAATAEAKTNATRADGQEVSGSKANQLPELVAKDKIFDYYWGNSDVAPPKYFIEQQRQQQLQAAQASSEKSTSQLGESKLMACARENDYESLRELLHTGADPNASDNFGETPLFEAALSGHVNMLALLLVSGADPAHISQGEMTATAVAADAPTKALLDRWQRLDCDDEELLAALQRVDTRDLEAVEAHCGVSLEELLQRRAASGREHVPSSPSSAPAGQAAADLHALATPVRYRVVYKKVAVRKEPNTKSPALRQMAQGEIVEMFEWDESQSFRRVRILAIRDVDEGGGMQETDGWVLISSPTLGPLLQQVAEGELQDEPDEEEDLGG
eukprot:TRINITY_DN89638_c0_g1_i1.p1 TRINITY_DN89638_c0_g1~~TRINITY_DN89638_c0_g1_i1.p1  ORF type:complete len:576 (-),score=161.54 TRINITY_DN89638_c0_g1_i1:23-1708(-)